MIDEREMGETHLLAALIGISEMIGGLTDLEEVLCTIVRIVPQLVGVDRSSIFLYNKERREFVPAESFGPDKEKAPLFRRMVIKEEDVPRLAHRLLRQKLPLVVKDTTKEEIIPQTYVKTFGIKSILIVPLVCKGEVRGVMTLDNTKSQHYFTSKEVNVVMGIATQAAVAIENAQLAQDLRAQKRKLEATVNLLADGLLTMDKDLRILSLNPLGEQLLGWKSEEIVGKKCGDVIRGIDENGVEVCKRDCLGRRILVERIELPEWERMYVTRKDGSRILCLVKCTVVKNEKGELDYFLYAFKKMPKEIAKETGLELELPLSASATPPKSKATGVEESY